MPKNVVKRLQNLENEIKTVLSIYDVSSKESKAKATNKDFLQNSSNLLHIRGRQKVDTKGVTKPVLIRSPQKEAKGHVSFFHKKNTANKPLSAPASGLNIPNEAAASLSKKRRSTSIQRTCTRGERLVAVDSSEWFDCTPLSCEIPDTSEAEVEFHKDTPTDLIHYRNENCSSKPSAAICMTCQRKYENCVCSNTLRMRNFHESEEYDGSSSIAQNRACDSERTEAAKLQSSALEESHLTHGRVCMNKCCRDPKYEPDATDEESNRPWKTQETENCPATYSAPRPVTAPAKSEMKERETSLSPRSEKAQMWNKTKRNDINVVTGIKKYLSCHKIQTVRDSSPQMNLNEMAIHEMLNNRESKVIIEGLDDESRGGNRNGLRQCVNMSSANNEYCVSDSNSSTCPTKDFANLRQKKALSDATSKKIAEIIQKNHEKIEEMRKSKILALSMVQDIREKYDALTTAKKETDEKMKRLNERNEKLMKELKEANESKELILQGWENFKRENSECALISKLKCLNDENNQFREQIQIMQSKLKVTPEISEADSNALVDHSTVSAIQTEQSMNDYNVLLKRQEAAYLQLTEGISVLEKVIKNKKEKEKRLSDIKVELKKRAVKTQYYIQRLSGEKVQLINVINELRAYVNERQSRITELQDELSKKDEELERHKLLIKEKTDTLDETNKELESIRKNSQDLEEQVRTLRISVENFDQMYQNLLRERQNHEEIVKRIQEENLGLQEQIGNEKDAILIKNKIIEDQQETIKQLREKSEEAKELLKKNESLERLLNVERDEKLEMQETIEHLRWRKEELKQRIKSLEGDLLLAPQEVVRDLQKTQIVLHELENQVQIKQKEWELHLQSLMREKEQACNVAAFATQKLMQTTSEFQKQSVAHKKLYKILADNLAQKKKSLPESNEKVKPVVRFSEKIEESRAVGIKGCESTCEDSKKPTKPTKRFRYHPGILKKSDDCFVRNHSIPEDTKYENTSSFPEDYLEFHSSEENDPSEYEENSEIYGN